MDTYTRRRHHHGMYTINKSRFVPFITVVLLVISLLVLLFLNLTSSKGQYAVDEFIPDHLLMYFETGMDLEVPWYYLAAIDKAEDIPEEEINKERSSAIALHLMGIKEDNELPLFLKSYNDDKAFIKKVVRELEHFEWIQEIFKNKGFPIADDYEYNYKDGYGDARTYGGDRSHEGIDIMADMDIPILSVGDGVIEQVGWNELGGWRLGIRGEDNIYYYYAHMSRYQGKPEKGNKIEKGQLIGYIGDSGYGVEGTTGEFVSHLHFAMYKGKGRHLEAFNPFPFLKVWE